MIEKNSNMASPLPWFRMFAAHYISDRDFRTSGLEERGLIFSMLLECWISTDVPNNYAELAQILGVPSDQVKRALTSRVTTFFKIRDNSFYSEFLDDQRNKFLAGRELQREGGRKGAANKRRNQSEGIPKGEPNGEPEGSLYQFNSSSIPSNSIKSNSVKQEGIKVRNVDDKHNDWISAYDSSKS